MEGRSIQRFSNAYDSSKTTATRPICAWSIFSSHLSSSVQLVPQAGWQLLGLLFPGSVCASIVQGWAARRGTDASILGAHALIELALLLRAKASAPLRGREFAEALQSSRPHRAASTPDGSRTQNNRVLGMGSTDAPHRIVDILLTGNETRGP